MLQLQRGPGPERAPAASSTEGPHRSTQPERVLRCAACGIEVTRPRARIEVSGSHRHVFCNPAGVVFEIGCFEVAVGAAAVGPAESFFSWFPGYAWRPAICRGCRVHLGWCYGEHDFWGLILASLTEDDAGDPAPR